VSLMSDVGTNVSNNKESTRILWLLNVYEKNYTSFINNIAPSSIAATYTKYPMPTLSKVVKNHKVIITTRADILKFLTKDHKATPFTYAGSVFKYKGATILIIDTIKYAPYDVKYCVLTSQYIAKLTRPEIFPPQSPLSYIEVKYKDALVPLVPSDPIAVAVDIETIPHTDHSEETNLITMIGFSYIKKDLSLSTFVVPLETIEQWEICRDLLASDTPKIMHGGRYDSTLLLKWGLPPRAYTFDTMVLFHSWFHDMRKTLGHVTAFCVRDSKYWKEGRKSTNRTDKIQYNARDVYYTALSFLFLIRHTPSWAKEASVYKMKRGHHAVKYGLRGMNTSAKRLQDALDMAVPHRDALLLELRTSLGSEDFNPASPKQSLQLMKVLTYKQMKVTNADADVLDKVSRLSTFNHKIIELITEVRRANKLIGTYLEAELTDNGRLLYGLNVLGTTSDRWASNTSDLWASPVVGKSGKKLKNSPKLGQAVMVFTRNTGDEDPLPSARSFIVPDEGMIMGSCDLPQSESRFTGYISEDEALIEAVESDLDFHKNNASKFFGVPYEEVTKALRQLAKPVNHGANYNMGAFILLQTMGVDNIIRAQILLALPTAWQPIQVAMHLLKQFRRTYPRISMEGWYKDLIKEVLLTGKITTPWGWTKQVFNNPASHKPTLNTVISSKPQNMSSEYLHRGLDILEEKHTKEGVFEILCPIHDEILFQCLPSIKDEVSDQVVSALTQTYVINGRDFTIVPDPPQFGEVWTQIH